MKKILYVNHKKQQCGVYEFGKNIGDALLKSTKHKFNYCECDSFQELQIAYKSFKPEIIIYNYHPSTMGWIDIKGNYKLPLTYSIDAIHIGTIHEVYQQLADKADNTIFDFHIAADPTLLLKNPIVYKTGRLLSGIPRNSASNHTIPVIGSFGFATAGKGFDKIVKIVQEEFDEAIINLNIPYSKFCDETGANARRIADECRSLINKSNIKLNISHEYLDNKELQKFLSLNSVNVFLYDDQPNRGISSTPDAAIVSGRPIAISKSRLFRHLFDCNPSICIEDSNLKQIIANGTAPIEHLWKEWSSDTLVWDYERIIHDILQIKEKNQFKNRQPIKFLVKKALTKAGFVKHQNAPKNVWTKTEDEYTYIRKRRTDLNYAALKLPPNVRLNGILDNDARNNYKPTINFLKTNLPELIEKKIPEANVQQAFVLDTCIHLAEENRRTKILAVGSFEDTAVEGLKLLNYQMSDIDPIKNYDLQTYLTKPGVQSGMYDIVISTSVIEHVEKDEQFIKDIAYLIKKGGYGILTCDYNDNYKKGDDIPSVDFRFYTMYDLKERLMKAIPDCTLIDEPKWECDNPDFYLAGKYNYTFASLVFQKAS